MERGSGAGERQDPPVRAGPSADAPGPGDMEGKGPAERSATATALRGSTVPGSGGWAGWRGIGAHLI